MVKTIADPKIFQESWVHYVSYYGSNSACSSSLILRVIGVNFLGILPFDFSILNY
jgi:hypothetical protein